MTLPEARIHYRNGLAALSRNDPTAASTCFLQAIESERRNRVREPERRYLSYYGLSLARAEEPNEEAISACRAALGSSAADPTLYLNLSRVYRLSGKLTRALEALEEGLRATPHDAVLLGERSLIERRARPLLPGLGRSHPVNRWLGRLRRGRDPRSTERAAAWITGGVT